MELENAVKVSEVYAGLISHNRRMAVKASNPRDIDFYQSEAAADVVFLESVLDEFDSLPKELEQYDKLVKQLKEVFGPVYDRAYRVVEAVSADAVSIPMSKKNERQFRDRSLSIYENSWSDEGDEVETKVLEMQLKGDAELFYDVPRSVKILECVVEDQQLNLDCERSMLASGLRPYDTKYDKINFKVARAAKNRRNRFLLQELYDERVGNGY